MTDTPITDAFENGLSHKAAKHCNEYTEFANFARMLERENAALRYALTAMVSIGCEYYDMDIGENGSAALGLADKALSMRKDAL